MPSSSTPVSKQFSELHAPLTIRNKVFKNRMFMAPHGTGYAKGGRWGEQALAYYKARLDGGVSLIVSEATQVVPVKGQEYAQLNGSDARFATEVKKLSDLCASYDARCIIQLYNEGRARAHSIDGSVDLALSPSNLRDERFRIVPLAMNKAQIDQMIQNFASSARHAVQGGADGVELLIGMGYLHAQFLSPRINNRTDEYGGSVENRHRFIFDTLQAMRRAMGDTPLLGFRIVPEDTDPDGLLMEDSLPLCEEASRLGLVDYISVTVGSTHTYSGTQRIVPSMYFEPAEVFEQAKPVREATKLPIFVAGRINQPSMANSALTSGAGDMVGFVRALLTDPQFPNKVLNGKHDDIRACIGCNQACIGHRNIGHGVSCIQFPESGRELEYGTRRRADQSKRVVVVGGGPAGMKAAAVSAERGHEVILLEQGNRLGGQALLAQALPGRAEFGGIITNLAHELSLQNVDVRLKQEATAELLQSLNPDEVVLATGAYPYMPDGEFEGANVVQAWDVVLGKAKLSGNVIVADWRCDWIGAGVAEMLALLGHKVTLCVLGEMAAEKIQAYARYTIAGRLHTCGVEVIPYLRIFGADEDTAYLQHVVTGQPHIIEDTGTVVMAWGSHPNTSLHDQLCSRDAGFNVHVIGDSLSPRTAEEAVLDGLKIGAYL